MTPADRTQQLRNDVDELYAMVGDIQQTVNGHTEILAAHTAELAVIRTELDEHTRVLGEHTATLADHGHKLDEILEILRPTA